MATNESIAQSPVVEQTPIFIIPDGPCFNPEINEWEIWVDGEVEAWAETESQANRSYLEMLEVTRKHIARNSDNLIFINFPGGLVEIMEVI